MLKNKKKLKVALVHDYLREYGGAERVLEAIHQLFPEAPVYVAFLDQQNLGQHWLKFKDWDIRQTWLTKIPFYKQLFSPLRIWAPKYFQSLDLNKYDLVISSSNAYFAKAVRVPNGTHICYCHTPPRAIYGYSTMADWKKNPLVKFFGTLINHYLRVVDFQVAQKVDYFVANSEETKRRIQKFYRREATVIYPPVLLADLKKAGANSLPRQDFFLYVNRLALAKHPELAVQACTKLKLPLKVVGDGKMLAELKRQAGATVEFLGSVDDVELAKLYSQAKALIYPVEDEDFGLVPVEAMSYGTPVIAHRSGGPIETVQENTNGIFFDDLSVSGLVEALQTFSSQKFDQQLIKKSAEKYTLEKFQEKIQSFLNKKINF